MKIGVNYTTVNGLADNDILQVAAKSKDIYVATEEGLSVSQNSGASWITRTIASGLGSNWINDVLTQTKDQQEVVYVATAGGLFKTILNQ